MIYLDRNKKEPLYMQLYLQIRQEITDGILTENQVLTGSRGLAKILQVSRNTVDSAYSQLVAEGYITPRKGIGHEVAKIPKIKEVKREKLHLSNNVVNQEDIFHSEILYDLTNHSHTSDLFPKSSWRKYTLECLERLEQEAKISSYQDKQGELYLRQNLLSYLKRIRGVHCDESQIIITCGIQQSLDYICKLLPSKYTTILMEEPGFNKAASVFGNNKKKYVLCQLMKMV
jgi:GntR family transcriptional regulator/MocR family aminotransferase